MISNAPIRGFACKRKKAKKKKLWTQTKRSYSRRGLWGRMGGEGDIYACGYLCPVAKPTNFVCHVLFIYIYAPIRGRFVEYTYAYVDKYVSVFRPA
jgi:hypothetical protein